LRSAFCNSYALPGPSLLNKVHKASRLAAGRKEIAMNTKADTTDSQFIFYLP